MASEPKSPQDRSVWVAVLMTVIAMLLAKACVGAMKPDKPRARSAYSGGR